MAYFCYNVAMGMCSVLLPPQITGFIEANLPVKGGWLSALTYLFLYWSNSTGLDRYQTLVTYMSVLIAILEMT